MVGDDLFVINKKRLAAGIKLRTAGSILVKVNQIGNLTDCIGKFINIEYIYRFFLERV